MYSDAANAREMEEAGRDPLLEADTSQKSQPATSGVVVFIQQLHVHHH